MTNKPMLSVEREALRARIKYLFEYNEETGAFTRIVEVPGGRGKVGMIAGSPDGAGYLMIRVDGRRYKAYQLAWLYVTGNWPKDMIDHRDMNVSNNAFANLRECNNGQNKMNSGVQANNKLGIKNVHVLPNGSFKASVGKDKKYHQKIFKTAEAASAWAASKRIELHGEFAYIGGLA